MKKDKKGFTLIEIIVVIVILAVLMAVAVPSVLKYVNEADNAKYLALSRAINEEVSVYITKELAGKTGEEFKKTVENKLIRELTWGSDSKISSIISTKPLKGEQIYSIGCSFDGKYSQEGWDYDETLDQHTITKISIIYCKAGEITAQTDVKAVVTLINKSMYYYTQDEIFDEINKNTEKAPIWRW